MENNDSSFRFSNQFLRLMSINSSCRQSKAEFMQQDDFKPHFTKMEFFVKIAQLIVAIICAGLYTKGNKLITNSITTLMFPNVVFIAFIIITSVITISYIIGHTMPDILIRIFNALGAILYFVTAGITGQVWIVLGSYMAKYEHKELEAHILLVVFLLSILNSFLYGLDVYLNIRRIIKEINL